MSTTEFQSSSQSVSGTDANVRAELDTLRQGLQRAERRVGALGVSLVAIAVGSALLPMASPAMVQGYTITLQQLLTRVIALETATQNLQTQTQTTAKDLQVQTKDLQTQITKLDNRVTVGEDRTKSLDTMQGQIASRTTALETKTQDITRANISQTDGRGHDQYFYPIV